MKKQFMADTLVIDVCPQCGGIWLDKAELDFLKNKARQAEKDQNLALALVWLTII